jgi:RES domain-containing protein
MRAHRPVKVRHGAAALDASAARTYGGRWNRPGTALDYASESIALAALELLIHLHRGESLSSYRRFTLIIPDATILTLDESALPGDWRAEPAPTSTALLGDRWVASGAPVALSAPSTVIPEERNVLLNPAHEVFAAIAAGATEAPFGYDPRLARSPAP